MATIVPTVVIGLGGTGKAIVQDVRSRVLARYGSLERVPVMRFLSLDTDLADPDEQLKGEAFFHGSRRLADAEMLHLSISQQKMHDIKTHLRSANLAAYYPYLGDWLELSAMAPPQVAAGAGQIRQIGRLSLFENYTKVEAYINSAIKDAVSEASIKATTTPQHDPLQVDMQFLNIYVVGSIIGGTGSGLFIDTGYLLQTPGVKASIQPRQCDTTGIFVVPLAGTTRGSVDTRASAYAALRELNHYCDHETKYEVQLPDDSKFETTEPPYAFTFLVSTKGEGGTDLTPRKLVELIGQTIFLECTSNFFKQVRANRINIQAQMTENDQRGCNQSFLTFGLATLEVPAAAVANASATRILERMFRELRYGKWAERPQDFKLAPTAAAAALSRHGLTFEEIRRKLATVEGDRTMEQILDGRLSNLQTLSPGALRDEVVKLEKEVDANIVSPEGAGAAPGAWAAAVLQNVKTLQGNVGQLLDDMVSAMTVSPDERLMYALQVLRETKTVCDRDVAQAGQILEAAKRDLDNARRLRDRYRGELIRIALDPMLRYSLWHGMATHEYASRYYGVACRRYYEKCFNLLVCKQATEFLERMKRDVDVSVSRATTLDNYLADLMSEMGRKSKAAESAFQPVNGILLAEGDQAGQGVDKLVNETYERALGRADGGRDRLNAFIGEHLRNALYDESGRADAFRIQKKSTIDQDAFIDGLLVEAREVVLKQGGVDHMSALDEFYSKSVNHSGVLQQLKSLSSPYLPLDRSSLYYTDSPVKSQRMVGLQSANSNSNNVTTFRKQAGEVDASLSGTDGANRFVEIEDPARIIWYAEYGAFPLRIWPHLEPMRTQYEAHLHKKELPIHTRRKDFMWLDITKPAPEDKARARRVFLACNIPGMDIFTQQGSEYTFRWRDEADLETVESFSGDLDVIVERLCTRPQLLELLEDKLQIKRAQIGDEKFAAAFRSYRNEIASKLAPAKAAKFIEPLDEYMKLNGILDLLRGSKGDEETAVPTFTPAVAEDGAAALTTLTRASTACAKCGKELRADARFCDGCGTPRG